MLEGLDGSGTTTQMRLLSERLTREKTPHTATCEPTDGPIGRLLRTILSLQTKADPRTIAFLYAADRNEHVRAPRTGIEARSRLGEMVISDRYLFSSLAYQSIDCGLEFVMGLNASFPLPQYLIFIDTPVAVCQERLKRRGRPELFDGLAFQSRVRDAYLTAIDLFREEGMRISILDGARPIGLIHDDVWNVLSGLPISGV